MAISDGDTDWALRERVMKLETVNYSMNSNVSRLEADIDRISDSYNTYKDTTVEMFSEINKSLAIVDSTVKNMASSISDLKDIVKDTRVIQESATRDLDNLKSLNTLVNDIDVRTRHMDDEICRECHKTMADYKEFRSATKASWKTIVVVASVSVVLVSAIWGATWTIVSYNQNQQQISQKQ